MASVRLRLEGQPGAITLPVFIAAVSNSLKVLREFDVAITRLPQTTLDWFVSDLRIGSLVIEVASLPKSEQRNVGPEVVDAFVNGLESIELRGVTPPLLPESGMQSYRRLVKLVGEGGATGIEVSTQTHTVQLSARAAVNVDQLLKIRRRSVGSVEGKIETISIHGRPRVIVYQTRTNKAVPCRFPSDNDRELIQAAKTLLGERVNVAGVVHLNTKGEPMRVDVRTIRRLRPRQELPSIEDIGGSVPEFSGELSTEGYMRSIRVG